MGMLFLWIYKVYYEGSGDVFHYMNEYANFGDGLLSLDLIRQPRVKWFIWATYPFYILGMKSLVGTTFVFIVFSIVSKWVFFQSYKGIYELNEWVLFIAIFLVPSFVFWTSGVTKESFVVSLILLSFSIMKKENVISKIGVLIMSLLILQIKPYIFVVLLLFYGVYLMFGLNRKAQLLFAGIMSLALVLIWCAFPEFSPLQIVNTININAQSSLELKGGSDVYLDTWGESFFMKMLYSLNVVLFKPFIWKGVSLIIIFQSIEKVLIVILVIFSFLRRDWNLPKQLNLLLIGWVIALSILLTLSSPNLGTLSRYSVYYSTVLVYFLLANLSFSKTGLQSNSSNKARLQGETHQPTPKKK